jgi:hypothetical protein
MVPVYLMTLSRRLCERTVRKGYLWLQNVVYLSFGKQDTALLPAELKGKM